MGLDKGWCEDEGRKRGWPGLHVWDGMSGMLGRVRNIQWVGRSFGFFGFFFLGSFGETSGCSSVSSPKQGHVELLELVEDDFMYIIGEKLIICRFAVREGGCQ